MGLDRDLLLVIGLLLIVLAFPLLAGAWASGRRPRAAIVLLAVGLSLALMAEVTQPGGYDLRGIEEAIFGVIGRLVHP